MGKCRFILIFIPHPGESDLLFPFKLSLYYFRSPQKPCSVLLRCPPPKFFSCSNFCLLCPLPVKLLEEISQCHCIFRHYKITNVHTKGILSSCQQSQWSTKCHTAGFYAMLEKNNSSNPWDTCYLEPKPAECMTIFTNLIKLLKLVSAYRVLNNGLH